MFKRKKGYLKNMNKDFEAMISLYLDGEMKSEEKKIFEDYMKKNPDFLSKVDGLRNMIHLINQTPKLETSNTFLDKLDENINKKSNYWFSPKIQTAFVFSFSIIILLFMVLNNQNTNQNIIVEEHLKHEALVKVEVDTLKNDDFSIKQVKRTENK